MVSGGFRTTINGSGYNQFGKKIVMTQLRFSTMEAIFEVDPEVQRKIDPNRRTEIREFIIKAIKENEFFFSPFVFSARGAITESEHGWELSPGCKLRILDGQHRSAAMSSALSHLKSKMESAEESGNFDDVVRVQGYIDKLKDYPVSMQIYLDLNQQEERQLFSDINTERKDAHVGLVMQYDLRDEYTELTRNIAQQLKDDFEIEYKLSRLTTQNSAVTSLTTIRKCLIALFEGILTVKKGDPYYRRCSPHEVPAISLAFFKAWTNMFPKQMENRRRFVAGLTGIQVALAYTVFQLVRRYSITHLEAIKMLQKLQKHCTWQHNDPLFDHLYDPATGKVKNHSSTTAIVKTSFKMLNILDSEGL